MTLNFQPINALSPFLKTSQYFPEDESEFRVVLTNLYKDIANNVNAREIGAFFLQEQLTGQQYFDPANAQQARQTFRKVVPFSAALVAGANAENHGITTTPAFTFTHIYGTGKNAGGTLWVPFPQGGANTSMLEVNTTQVILTVPAAYAGFTAIVILEYLKN
jgi:hypothetical protein